MKKNASFLLIIIGLVTAFTFIKLPTDGYKELAIYIKWGGVFFSILVICYGIYLLLKKTNVN